MNSRKRDKERREAQRPLFHDVTVTAEDGREFHLYARVDEGDTPESLKAGALEYARALRRVEDAFSYEPTSEELDLIADAIARAAASHFVLEVLKVGEERFGGETVSRALGEGRHWDTERFVQEVGERYERAFRTALPEIYDLEAFAIRLEQNVTTQVVQTYEGEHDDLQALSTDEYDRLFSEAYDQHAPSLRANALNMYAQDIARAGLESANPHEATFEELLDLLRGDQDRQVAIGTAQFQGAMREGLRQPNLEVYEKLVKSQPIDGKRDQALKVRTEVNAKQQERIVESLLKWKENGIALLKLHLDLTNQAFKAKSDKPTFTYYLADALERQGHKRRKDGAFQTKTLRNLRERLKALESHLVSVYRMVGDEVDTPAVVAKAPFWRLNWRYEYERKAKPDEVEVQKVDDADEENYYAVEIEPGGWWQYARMTGAKAQFFKVPEEVLQLPHDGQGHEPNRIAIRFAIYLATHVRINHNERAGNYVPLKVGTLLEQSGYMTRREFLDDRNAKRIREYIHHETEESGALRILRALNAFDVKIESQDEFFVQGRGWREKFLDAKLLVYVPPIPIEQRKPKKALKRDS